MPARPTAATVVFRVAGGPRLGFGHLMRALTLARALGVVPLVSLRGGGVTRARVGSLGGVPVPGGAARVLDPGRVRLLIVDDPSAAAAGEWVRHARARRIPVVSVHDLGRGAVPSNLAIDGSLPQPRTRWPADRVLCGPRFAVLDAPPVRNRPRAGRGLEARRVVVSLGGGRHARAGVTLAVAIAAACPGVDIAVSTGFVGAPSRVPPTVKIVASGELKDALARADVAVVGGGITLYEAAALGVPAVAIAVVAAQRPTIAAFVRAGSAIRGGASLTRGGFGPVRALAVARLVAGLLADPDRRRRMSRAGRRTIDGRGLSRVQRELERRYHALRVFGSRAGARQDG